MKIYACIDVLRDIIIHHTWHMNDIYVDALVSDNIAMIYVAMHHGICTPMSLWMKTAFGFEGMWLMFPIHLQDWIHKSLTVAHPATPGWSFWMPSGCLMPEWPNLKPYGYCFGWKYIFSRKVHPSILNDCMKLATTLESPGASQKATRFVEEHNIGTTMY